MMNKDNVLEIESTLFRQQAPDAITIMNTRRNAKGTVKAIMHQNGTAAMALPKCYIINRAARTVNHRVVNVANIEFRERLMINA